MKPIYKSVILTQAALSVSLSLQANVYSGDATATQAVPAESLQGLRVQLISPNVSGARDLIASGECTISGATLNVNLNAVGMIPGTHRLVVKAEFGTQTVVLYGLDITVPASFEEGDAQEFEDTITVVSTIGDGGESTVVDKEITKNSQNPVTSAAIYAGLAGKADAQETAQALAEKQPIGDYADATVYAKDGDGNAHITTPLSIGDGVATSDGAVASGYADGENSSIVANGDGAVASGYAGGTGSSIQATSGGAVASGYADGTGSSIQATSNGAVASGYADGENSSIRATSNGAVASGKTYGENSNIQATSDGAVASGYADGENSSIRATSNGAVASGYVGGTGSSIQATSGGAVASGYADGTGSSIEANGNGAVASGYANGDGSSIQASGDGAVASGKTYGENSNIQASSDGAVASGYADDIYGNVVASGQASQAFGIGVQATQIAQMVLGKCNVVDTNGDYALIVGNGADNQNRSNAFAIDWNGNLVLFNAGTPVILTPAKLATLIA